MIINYCCEIIYKHLVLNNTKVCINSKHINNKEVYNSEGGYRNKMIDTEKGIYKSYKRGDGFIF